MIYLLVIIGVLFLLLLYGVSIYSRLAKLRSMVQEGWSSMDAILKERYDLIPNFLETVKKCATHERATLDSVTRARSLAMNAEGIQERQKAEKNLGQALISLYAVAEQYPNLKTDASFLHLQGELDALESDLEKSRNYYNRIVRENNILVETFPSSFIAKKYQFTELPFFELENTFKKAVPAVKF